MFKTLIKAGIAWLLLCSISHAATGAYTLPSGEIVQDPTRPADWQVVREAAQPAKQFQLNYILSSSERSLAMINGQRVGEGDRINGARVVRITAESVTLNVDGQTRVLQTKARKSVKK